MKTTYWYPLHIYQHKKQKIWCMAYFPLRILSHPILAPLRIYFLGMVLHMFFSKTSHVYIHSAVSKGKLFSSHLTIRLLTRCHMYIHRHSKHSSRTIIQYMLLYGYSPDAICIYTDTVSIVQGQLFSTCYYTATHPMPYVYTQTQ